MNKDIVIENLKLEDYILKVQNKYLDESWAKMYHDMIEQRDEARKLARKFKRERDALKDGRLTEREYWEKVRS